MPSWLEIFIFSGQLNHADKYPLPQKMTIIQGKKDQGLKLEGGHRPDKNNFIQQYFVKSMVRNKAEGVNERINKPINGEIK